MPTINPGDKSLLVSDLQRDLAALGLYLMKIDGDYGPRTRAAIDAFEESAGIANTKGIVNDVLQKTIDATAQAAPEAWPHDDEAALESYYGDPDDDGFMQNLTHVTPPFVLKMEGALVKSVLIHKRCAASLTKIFDEIWAAYGKDQLRLDATGFTSFSGSYNNRSVRGSAKKSCHAFGAALDFDAEHNWMNYNHDLGKIPKDIVAIFKKHGWYWGGDFHSRQDPMHFQAAREG